MADEVTLRGYEHADLEPVLRLNELSVHFLSPMDRQRLQTMLSWSARLNIAQSNGEVAGFLLTFEDGSDYDSVNYRWFASHLKRFVYVDRIVIDQRYRGKGIGQQMYRHLRDNNSARTTASGATIPESASIKSEGCKTVGGESGQGALWLAAEIDIEPRNDYSLNFHRQQGFVEVARQSAGQGKQVSLQVLSI